MLIAYSTVSQIGYLFLVMPLALAPLVDTGAVVSTANYDAWSGGIYQALSHGLAKASMFLAAGSVLHALGHDHLSSLRGVAERMPITAMSFGMAGISLIGLPPSGGFIAKWFLLRSSVASGQWWWTIVLILGGLLAATYILVVLRQMLLRADETFEMQPVPRLMELATFGLALGSVLLGIRAVELLEFLEIGGPFPPGSGE